MNTSPQQRVQRFSVAASAGKGPFQVWDKWERRGVSRHRTFQSAQAEARQRNDAETAR